MIKGGIGDGSTSVLGWFRGRDFYRKQRELVCLLLFFLIDILAFSQRHVTVLR